MFLVASVEWTDAAARMCVAALAGATLGWEREARSKPAGLRTHMLVALGAALFVLLALELNDEYLAKAAAGVNTAPVQLDAMRVLGGIIGGIGFLGAGAIIESRGDVRGLTTAAGIWLVAAIGAACGLGYYRMAFIAVGLALAVLLAVGLIESKLFPATSAKSRTPDNPSDDRPG